MSNEKIEEEAPFAHKLLFCIARCLLLWDGRNVKALPAVKKEFSKRKEVTISSKYFESALSILAKHSVNNMVLTFSLLGITDAPLLDRIQIRETLHNMEFALILFVVIHVIEHTLV